MVGRFRRLEKVTLNRSPGQVERPNGGWGGGQCQGRPGGGGEVGEGCVWEGTVKG